MHRTARQIYKQMLGANKILLVPHQNPDGDAIGSVSAMSHFLQQINKPHQTYCLHPTPDKLKKYPHLIEVKTHEAVWQDEEIDLIIILDSGDLKYAGIEHQVKNLQQKHTLINIDHHPTNQKYGHHNLVIDKASSTTEILYYFFKKNDVPISKPMAMSLLVGLMTDTENFTNPGTTVRSLSVASNLIQAGANFNLIKNIFIKDKNVSALRLWGDVLSRLDKHESSETVYTYITKKDLEEKNLNETEIEGMANFLNNLGEGRASLVLKQTEDNRIKGSLRTTRDDFDVSAIAQKLGGGGHKKASGFTLEVDSVEEAFEKIWEVIEQIKK